MSLLAPSDFTAFLRLARGTQDDTLIQAFIDKYETTYIYRIYGIALGKLIIADITSGTSPTQQKYKDIWDSFAEEGDSDEQLISEGALYILKCCILWHYLTENTTQVTQAGVTKPQIDTQAIADTGRHADNRWNSMLESWHAIHVMIEQNLTDYPEFVYIAPPDAKFGDLI